MLTSVRSLLAASITSAIAISSPVWAAEASDDAETQAVADQISGETTVIAPLTAIDPVITDISQIPVAASPESKSELQLDRAVKPAADKSVSKIGGSSGLTFSANVTLTNDYRFRGVGLSDGDFAIQGGMDISHSSGIYVGTWASSLDETVGFGSTELDFYGGWSGDITEGVTLDAGLIYYTYFDAPPGDFDYFETYGSVALALGPAEAKFGVAYAFDQASLGSQDNLYLYSDLSGSIPNTPITLAGHVGFTDGALTYTANGKAWDFSIGADWAVTENLTAGVKYTTVEGPSINHVTDDAFVFSLTAAF
ncbi:MAG: TorF family putative porin [Sphingomonadaceae bacterium]